jgi:outer membrane lipase/esterase
VPQAEIALGVAQRPIRDLYGRLLTLRNPVQNPNQKLGVFVNGDVNFGNQDANNRSSGFDFDTKGVTVGADYRVTPDLALGLAFNYANSNSDLNNDRGNISIDSYSFSAYGGYSREKFYADALVNYGWNDFEIERNIKVTGFRSATASTRGNQFSVRLNTGYNFGQNQLSIGPMLGVRYSKVTIDGYSERNGSILNLNVSDQAADSVILNVGAQLAYDFRTPSATVTPYIAANYEHEFANDSRTITTELATQPGIPNRTITGSPDRDFVRLSAGLQTQFANNLSIGVGYETILGKRDLSDHFVQARIRYEF